MAVARIYQELKQQYTVENFNIEPVMGSIRPDAAFQYVENGITKIGLLEVELSHKSVNTAKYNNFVRNGEPQNFGFTRFTLFVCQKSKLEKVQM